jgi:hypothetical protein
MYEKCKECGQRKMEMEVVLKEFAFLTMRQVHTEELAHTGAMLMRQYERQRNADMWIELHKRLEKLEAENRHLKDKIGIDVEPNK